MQKKSMTKFKTRYTLNNNHFTLGYGINIMCSPVILCTALYVILRSIRYIFCNMLQKPIKEKDDKKEEECCSKNDA